jgi:hypothetical protein
MERGRIAERVAAEIRQYIEANGLELVAGDVVAQLLDDPLGNAATAEAGVVRRRITRVATLQTRGDSS